MAASTLFAASTVLADLSVLVVTALAPLASGDLVAAVVEGAPAFILDCSLVVGCAGDGANIAAVDVLVVP